MDIEYNEDNQFGYLGFGYVEADRRDDGKRDLSPYINLDEVDPKWLKAVGVTVKGKDVANDLTPPKTP